MNQSHFSAGRRQVLKSGILGAGLSLTQFLRLTQAGTLQDQGRSGILVFLQGGPSHQDTFDLKPEASAEFRGQFQPIRTSAPGVEICEHLPRLAARADQYAIVRGISHNLAAHDLGTTYLLTGNRPNPLLKYPSYGSVASRQLPVASDLPAYVAIDRDPEGPGFLGIQYGALSTGEHPRVNRPFSVRGITLDEGLSVSQFQSRRNLRNDLDTAFRGYEQLDDEVRSVSRFSEQAYQIISSPRARAAFDLSLESPAIARQFGTHDFSQSLLLASRLIEAGVRFVTVLLDGWDTHQDNFAALEKNLLPGLDQGLSALLGTLEAKGLFASTSVLVTGEFGRTPKINGNTGRDHWARAMVSLLAGGAVRGGQVIGASDETASEPAGDGYTPDDLAATFYHSLGIDPAIEFQTDAGRPITLVRDGSVIGPVFG